MKKVKVSRKLRKRWERDKNFYNPPYIGGGFYSGCTSRYRPNYMTFGAGTGKGGEQ